MSSCYKLLQMFACKRFSVTGTQWISVYIYVSAAVAGLVGEGHGLTESIGELPHVDPARGSQHM